MLHLDPFDFFAAALTCEIHRLERRLRAGTMPEKL